MTLKYLTIVVVLSLPFGVAPRLLAQKAISGRVYEADTNKPLSGIRISTLATSATASARVPVVTRSGDDGSFTLTVPTGKYLICVDAGKAYLDPCRWSPGSTLVDTTQSASLDLALKKGVLLVVRVSDPAGAAQAIRDANPGLAKASAPQVSVSIKQGSAEAMPLPFVASSGIHSEFSLLVPSKTEFTLSVGSTVLALGDVSGSALPANALTASLTSPDGATSVVQSRAPGIPPEPEIPSRVFNVTIIGPLSH